MKELSIAVCVVLLALFLAHSASKFSDACEAKGGTPLFAHYSWVCLSSTSAVKVR